MNKLSKNRDQSIASITQCKNESTLLSHWLDVVGELVDHIIIFDDNSEDNSIDIIKSHKFYKKTHLLKRYNTEREEGLMFKLCHSYALHLNIDRLLISDVDEIPSVKGIQNFEYLLRKVTESIRLHRVEVALDQDTSYYDPEGTGKLVIVNTKECFFSKGFLHTSQPNVSNNQILINDINYASLTHYGPSDYASQVLKCLCYIIWERNRIGKPVEQSYEEYFKTYRNFVKKGEMNSWEYRWPSSPKPYEKFMYNAEIRNFCNSLDVFKDFDIHQVLNDFSKITDVKEKVINR